MNSLLYLPVSCDLVAYLASQLTGIPGHVVLLSGVKCGLNVVQVVGGPVPHLTRAAHLC